MPFKLSDHSKNLGVSQPALEVRARRREVLVEEVAEHRPEPRADRVEGPRQLLLVVSTMSNFSQYLIVKISYF